MPYRALKRIRFDRDYLVGEEIPDEVVDPARAKFLADSNYIVKLPDEPKEPEKTDEKPNEPEKSNREPKLSDRSEKKPKESEKTDKEPTDNDKTGEKPKVNDDLSDEK